MIVRRQGLDAKTACSLLNADAEDFDQFTPTGLPVHNSNRVPGDTKTLGEKSDQGIIRRPVDRGCCQANSYRVTMHSGALGS